ncbi:MAG: hypothetical protein Fur0010_23480 [Bdellovibrio sp.]
MSLNILLTTPDYPPKRGGLSTFTLNIEKSLRSLANVDILVWNSINDLKNYQYRDNYDFVIHVHFMGGYFYRGPLAKQINFVHGSEIAMTSPVLIKRMAKKILRPKIIQYFESSFFNIFISTFTLNHILKQGLTSSFSRDLVFHNLIEIPENIQNSHPQFDDDVLKFVCIARDVPHKNIDGAIEWSHFLSHQLKRKVHLTINAQREVHQDEFFSLTCLTEMSDEMRESLFQNAHFNLLPSLCHEKQGFFEGFGLTVLEAGKYGTPSVVYSNQGGQQESVHHHFSGLVVENNDHLFELFKKLDKEKYLIMRNNTQAHTISCHDAKDYLGFFRRILV